MVCPASSIITIYNTFQYGHLAGRQAFIHGLKYWAPEAMMIFDFQDKRLETADDEFYIAPSADLIGAICLGRRSSIWFHCVLRADDEMIEIGDGSNVQDGSIIHVDHDAPVVIGADTSLGHAVMVHSSRVGNETLIGNGAIVLDGAVIGDRCIVAAGSLVTPKSIIADGSVIMGNPAKVVRQTGDRDLALIRRAAAHYQGRCLEYRLHLRTPTLPTKARDGDP